MFKKSFFSLCVFFIASLLIINSAYAISISVNPSYQEVLINNSFDVSIFIFMDDEEPYGPPAIGKIDLFLAYDNTILAYSNLNTITDALDDDNPYTDPYDSEAEYSLTDSGDGSIQIIVTCPSLGAGEDGNLPYIQPGSFTLATLTFEAIGVGLSYLDIVSPPGLFDFADELENFGEYGNTEVGNGAVLVTGQSIPEPATFLLLGTLLVGFVVIKRKET